MAKQSIAEKGNRMSNLGQPEKIYEIPDPMEIPDHVPDREEEAVPA